MNLRLDYTSEYEGTLSIISANIPFVFQGGEVNSAVKPVLANRLLVISGFHYLLLFLGESLKLRRAKIACYCSQIRVVTWHFQYDSVLFFCFVVGLCFFEVTRKWVC